MGDIFMFICSVKASTLKLTAVIIVALAILITLSALGNSGAVYASADGVTVNYGGIKSNEDRVAFIESFGLKVNETPVAEEKITMPEDFDRIILGYNELQKSQGLDLSKYTKKNVTHYRYEVTNYDYEGAVYVNLIVHRNKIIACDISSGDKDGFVLPLVGLDKSKIK